MSEKFAWITGASSGIGEATAIKFAEAGWSLVIAARRIDRLDLLKNKLLELGAKTVTPLALDVRDQDSVAKFTDKAIVETAGRIDVLVNNAGLALGKDPIESADWSQLQTMMETNVYGVLNVTRSLLPHLRKQISASIIMTGSIAGHQVYEGGGVYCASKFALRAITDTLRLELNGSGIKVCSVDPGMVDTEFSLIRLGDAGSKGVYNGLSPLSGNDIAETIFFVASRPPHVCLNEITIMPTAQASVNKVHRT